MTDHRTQAEHWLAQASAEYTKMRSGRSVPKPYDERQAEALIGIGHALLALTDKPPMEPPPDMTGFPGFPDAG